MNRTVPYDPTRRALYTPCADALSLDPRTMQSEALLCAELSRLVYCRFESDEAIRQAIQSELAAIGFTAPIYFNENGLQAFLTINPAKNLAVLAYRGTEPNEASKDILTDLDARLDVWAGVGRVHKGFATSLARKWIDIAAALYQQRELRLLYTGHSLGAALATLTAALIRPAALYTFGSPRVGDAVFAASLADVPHERYVDCCDVVCTVPPKAFGYQHAGKHKYIDRYGAIHADLPDDEIETDRRRAAGAYALDHLWLQSQNVLLRGFADHAPVNYIYPLRA